MSLGLEKGNSGKVKTFNSVRVGESRWRQESQEVGSDYKRAPKEPLGLCRSILCVFLSPLPARSPTAHVWRRRRETERKVNE